MGRALGLLLLGWALSLAPFARVAAGADADELIRRGLDLRRAEKDADALVLFQQAYEQSKAPKALAQIGFAEQALGKWGAADRHLRAASQASGDPWISKHRKVIDDALGTIAKRVGRMDVRGGPSGAEVRVDGELIGKLPLPGPFSVTAGGVAVEVQADGYVSITRASVVAVGSLVRETFDLQPLAPPSVAPPSPVATVVPVTPAARPSSNVADAAGDSDRAQQRRQPADSPGPAGGAEPGSSSISTRSVVALTAVGLAAAALTVGVIEHVSWQNKASQFGSTTGCDPAAAQRGSATCQTLYDDGQRAKLFAIGGYGLGAGLLVTATILYLTAPAPDSNPQRQVACVVNPVALGAGCSLRF